MKHTYTNVFRNLLLLLVLLGLDRQFTQAQVKIGTSNEVINQGASLEVESGPYPGNVYRGFLPPKVALSDYVTWTLAGDPTDGMLIFNTATTTGSYSVTPGIYCWYNFQWNRQSPSSDPTKAAVIASVDCQPGMAAIGPYDVSLDLTASNSFLNQAKPIIVVPASAGPYNFFTGSTNGYQFRATGTFTAAQVGSPQTVNLLPSGTPSLTGTDSFTISALFSSSPFSYSTYCSFTINTTNAANCSGSLSGTYKVNTPFDASNTKQLTFVPPLAGDYKFRADVVQLGRVSTTIFSFTQSATFSADQVGKPQLVTLVAGAPTGAPTISGTYSASVQVDGPYYQFSTINPTGIHYSNVCQFNVTIQP